MDFPGGAWQATVHSVAKIRTFTWQQLTHIYIQLNHFARRLKYCKWGAVLGCSVMSDPWQSHGQAIPWTGSSVHGILQARILD